MNNENKRKKDGIITGLIGLGCNLLLCAAKVTVGLISGSVSIMSDAVNNLSDSGSSVVTVSSFVFSGKKADKEHPYGHGRFEHVASFIVGFLVIFAGFQFLVESIKKIIEPSEVKVSVTAAVILGISVLVKLFMMFFYRIKAKKISSDTLKAAAADSMFDIFCTLVVLMSFVLDPYLPFKTDGVCGVLVSLFVLVCGGKIVAETVGKLLGNGGDPELSKKLYSLFEGNDMILQAHELKLHEYGHDIKIGSIHAEMDKNLPLLKAHEVIHALELRAKNELNVDLVIHIDPVDFADPFLNKLRASVDTVMSHYHGTTVHDEQIIQEEKKILLHVKLPSRYEPISNAIKDQLSDQIQKSFKNFELEVNYEVIWSE